ncbi:MAG: hypothetical protein L0Y36_09295 [Planctomycetales bacterium]|nr:hypothetical protein [Planctomycetales bacterium]
MTKAYVKHTLLTVFFLIAVCFGRADTGSVPEVQSWTPAGGHLEISPSVIAVTESASDAFNLVCRQFAAELAEVLKHSGARPDTARGGFALVIDDELAPEAYVVVKRSSDS